MCLCFKFVAVEGFLTPVFDGFPNVLYGMRNRIVFTAIYCAVSFLIGLSMVTEVICSKTFHWLVFTHWLYIACEIIACYSSTEYGLLSDLVCSI